MLAFEPTRHYQTLEDWIKGAICQHSKYLTYQAYFGGRNKFNPRNPNQRPTKQQWQQGFAKNPNAMDLTPGRTRARCNGHYNRTPDLGKMWNVVEHVGLSKVHDTRREGTRL